MIGRLVQYQEVHRFEQQLYHGKAGAFAAAQHLHFLVRSFAAEHKGAQYVAYLQADVAHRHSVDGVEHRQRFVQQLRLVLRKVAYLHVMPQRKPPRIVGYFAHDALHEGGFSFAVLADKSHFFAPVDGEVHVVENNVFAVSLADILANDGVVSAAAAASELQAERRIVFFVHFDALYLLQLLDAALHLHGFRCLVAEALDEGFGIFYLLLLVFVGAELLFAAFLAQHYKLVVLHFIVVDAPAGDFDGAGGDVVQEGAVVAHQHDGIGTGGKEVLQPLYALYIKVIGRLVQQQHVGMAQQQLGKLDAHTPAARKLAGGPVEVRPAEAQALQSALRLCAEVGAAHHQEALVLAGEALYQLLIFFAFVVGAFGQFAVHPLDVCLQLEDVFEGEFGFFHHGAPVAEHHHLRKVTDGTFAGHSHHAAGRLLQPCQYLEHSGLAGTVLSHQRNAVFLVDDVGNVFKQRRCIKFHFQSFYRYHALNQFFYFDGAKVVFFRNTTIKKGTPIYIGIPSLMSG